MKPILRVLSLCDGISTGLLAFDKEFGDDYEIEYWGIEMDGNPRIISDINFKGRIKRPCNNILSITPRNMFMDFPIFDWVIFGFTCKSLSSQGGRKGLDGSSKILFNCMDILSMAAYRNKKLKFLIENVFSMERESKFLIDKIIGVEGINVPASLVSGQDRKRFYWANFEIKQPEDSGVLANSCLEDDGKEVLAWSKSTRYVDKNGKVWSCPGEGREPKIEERYRTDGKANTLVTGDGCQGPSTKNIVLKKDGTKRPLTVRECARLQSLPEWFSFNCVSDSKAYEALGNGWNLNAILWIIRQSKNKPEMILG